MPNLATKQEENDTIEISLDNEIVEEYNKLLEECNLTIDKIKKRKNARKANINKQK